MTEPHRKDNEAQRGDTVRVHYTGRLTDGREFDSSEGREPLEFSIGEGMLIPGFEEAVVGMKPGESREAKVAAEQAYGPRHPDMVFDVERSRLPGSFDPKVGERLQMQSSQGPLVVTVADVSESSVKIDANHPLAGEELRFEIRLIEVV